MRVEKLDLLEEFATGPAGDGPALSPAPQAGVVEVSNKPEKQLPALLALLPEDLSAAAAVPVSLLHCWLKMGFLTKTNRVSENRI